MNDISSTHNAFDVSLRKLRERFIERAYHQAQELDHLMGLIEADSDDQVARARVTSIAHKISGVARTLGFERLGLLAHETEYHLNGESTQAGLGTLGSNAEVVDELIEELDLIVSSAQH